MTRNVFAMLFMSTKPTILITVLKHHKYITELATMFNNIQLKNTITNLGSYRHDEADQASLNGYL